MSMATMCDGAEFINSNIPTHVLEAFREANGPKGKPVRLSYFEGTVPIVDWEALKMFTVKINYDPFLTQQGILSNYLA